MMGSNRREEGSVTVKNSNVFAALDTLRKKKKSDKGKSSSKKEQDPEILWAPAPLTVKSWADVDDEDDDDYYATTAPLKSFLGSNQSQKKEPVEEIESEDDLVDEDEDEDADEDDNDHESEVPEHAEPGRQKIEASPAPKETERQLSKKERKKKELAELEALLADFGVEQKEKGPDNLPDVADEKKEGQQAEDVEKKIGGTTEPKSAKKKKKKDKAKEVKESEDQPINVDGTIQPEETGGAEQVEDASTVDVKERLKRLASAKKKKSGKETAARAAAAEAAARSAKLAAAKKKEKSHYNQQPMR
ncbi:uncharacterized protein LOC132029811 [Lycium ferocissimum]|uniref:uncharacterized protein LOC132029811 n=1 Tax=Lycium ferocissimum TaxID=112874 RepID=UPI002815D5AB|nr:uncharacterized protein LOC132029811 [Lycium ferocissimum]